MTLIHCTYNNKDLLPLCMYTHVCTDIHILKSVKYFGNIKKNQLPSLGYRENKETMKGRVWNAKIKLIHSGIERRGRWIKDLIAERSDELQINNWEGREQERKRPEFECLLWAQQCS